ncbi:hypothetical protein BT96DRAFT_1005497 [Gymnopus androsaceus JB14]|uniref:Uncharacterized protein n=1 Tax=Gymnopus androsaceus JB14 TaxID=1447944 RepID=A0A6A4GMR1_9AGAR|nr:hypothetical protein BT96DRAFT_1005497 [Gymnopus androsaceus JB14]
MAIDYAMEICKLRLQLEMASTSLTVDPSLTPLVLTLNRLSATTSLGARTISFATRPPIQAKIADITVERKGGVEWSFLAQCTSHSHLSWDALSQTLTILKDVEFSGGKIRRMLLPRYIWFKSGRFSSRPWALNVVVQSSLSEVSLSDAPNPDGLSRDGMVGTTEFLYADETS